MDRERKLIFAAVVLVAVPMTWVFERLIEAGRAGDVPTIVALGLVFLIFWGSSLSFVIVLQLTKMTKTILRAIELASKSPE